MATGYWKLASKSCPKKYPSNPKKASCIICYDIIDIDNILLTLPI